MIQHDQYIPGFDGPPPGRSYIYTEYKSARRRNSKRDVGGRILRRIRMIQKRNRFLYPSPRKRHSGPWED